MLKGLGGLAGLGNLGEMMKKAEEMQAKMAELQNTLETMEVEGAAGAGAVTAVCTGKGALRRVSIEPSLMVESEKEVLEDLIVAAVNDAQAKATERAQKEMAELTAGLPIPPGLGFPG